MIRKFIASLENPEKPLLGPNYWLLMKMGLIFEKNSLVKAIYILIHEIVTFFVVTQYMELYVIRSDLDEVLTNLKISMLSIVCIVKANTFVFWQKSWKELIDYVTGADIDERANNNTQRVNILNSYTSYCRRVIHFYWILVFITFVTVISTPLIKFLSSATFRAAFNNGTEPFPHIFSSWMPFDKYSFPGNWITVVYHILLCAYGAGIMAAYDTAIIVIMVFFGGKLELLRERCRTIFSIKGSSLSDEQASRAIRELHTLHVLLMKNSRLFNSLLSPVMFLYVVMCSLMLCASAFQLTRLSSNLRELWLGGVSKNRHKQGDENYLTATNTTQKILMAEYFVFGVAQLFMFCWHSNDVLGKNNEVMLGPYESEWWKVGLKQKKSMLILAGQLKIVHVYTAGPFTELTLSTFVTILKGAYSYYALLRQ